MDRGDKIYREFITSTKWQRLRRQKINANPLCEMCQREGIVKAAQEVHHKTPVESAPARTDQELLMFSLDNLQSLCRECHKKVHEVLGKNTKEERAKRNESETKSAIEALYGD